VLFLTREGGKAASPQKIGAGNRIATIAGAGRSRPKKPADRSDLVRMAMAAWMTLALLLVGLSIGRASDRDETTVTVRITSADHEVQEGYFSLGDNVTVIAKPGTDLYRFLARQRGHKVQLQLTEAAGPELSRLER
jgi:hypothetical protein